MRLVVVGGGASGFSAAKVAKNCGVKEVILLERTDTLGGWALVSGIGLCGAGSFSVLCEATALGGASFYNEVVLPIAIHSDLMMPGFDRSMLFNVSKLDARMKKNLLESGIDVWLNSKVSNTIVKDNILKSIIFENGEKIEADVFVDATGSVTGLDGCNKYGNGCVECIQRCLKFGDPKGLVDDKINLISSLDANGNKGVTGTSYLIPTASLSKKLQHQVNKKGFAYIKVPSSIKPDKNRGEKAGSHSMSIMSQPIIKNNILLADIGGFVKVTANAAPRYAGVIREIEGMEDSIISQPLSGYKGHAVEGLAIAPRDNRMLINGYKNVLCAGIKSSHSLFLLDVAISGDFAGYNAARICYGLEPIQLPKTLAIGAFIAYVKDLIETKEGLMKSPQADKKTLVKLGVFSEDNEKIINLVKKLKLFKLFNKNISLVKDPFMTKNIIVNDS